MMEDLVRNDKNIGPSLTNYTISTELENISLKSVLSQLALPERKWFDLLKKIEEYFELSTNNIEQSITKQNCLFHYLSLEITEMSDENNIDIIYTLDVLKNNFPDTYKAFEETLKDVKVDELIERWRALLYTDAYLPELLRHLRNISYLSRLSLCGFSVRVIKNIHSSLPTTTDMYSRYNCSFDERRSLTDSSSLSVDKKPVISVLDIKLLRIIDGCYERVIKKNKLGGLLQKKIYVMPFSREVVLSTKNLEKIKEMLTECQNGKHILLVTPEQRLCF